jgi:Flp pilus assembly protein TadG
MTTLHTDQRGMVVSWLIKVVVGIAIVGLAAVEGGSIMFTKLGVQDAAESGATAGVEVLTQNPRDCQGAGQVAATAVIDRDSEIEASAVKWTCFTDGRFRLTVKKEASTILIGRISAIEDWAQVKGRATASPSIGI